MSSTIYFIKNLDANNFWQNPEVKEMVSKGLHQSLLEAEFNATHEKEPLSSPFSIFIDNEMVFRLEVVIDTLPSGEKFLRIEGEKYFSPSDLERLKNQHENGN